MGGLELAIGEMFYGKLQKARGEQPDGKARGDHAERRINTAMFISDLRSDAASLQGGQDKIVERRIEMASSQDAHFIRESMQRHDLAGA